MLYFAVFASGLSGVFGVLWLISRMRDGSIFIKGTKTLVLNPNGSYDRVWMRSKKSSIETANHDRIYHAREKTTYHSNGMGPNIAIVDPLADTSVNLRQVHYALAMKDGKNPEGKHFESYDEACLYAYENYILKDSKFSAIRDEQMNMVKRARGSETFQAQVEDEDKMDLSNLPHPEALNQNAQQATVQKLKPMTPKEYDRFLMDVRGAISEWKTPLIPIVYDGEVMTLNGYSKWAGTPAPAITCKNEWQDGYDTRAQEEHNQPDKMIKFAIAFAIIIGSIAIFAIILMKA